MTILEKLLGGVAAPVVDYFKRRMELKAEERQQERAIRAATVERQIDLIKQGLTADMNWEMEFAQQARTSWKDEYTLGVVSLPLVMAFIPGMDQYVALGFAAFGTTPLWYQVMVQVMFYATVGVRFWRRNVSDT